MQIIILNKPLQQKFQKNYNSNRTMKKSTNIFRFAIPSGQKLQKKKNKYLEINNTKQLNEQKTYIVQVFLNNKNKSIKFKFQAYKPLSQVKETIYNKVNKYRQNIGKVIGFFTSNSNFAYDYKFQAGYGFLDRNITINCLFYQNMQGLQKYKICCCLAIGGFSKVFLVRSKINGQFFAAKFIDKSKKKLISVGLIQNQKQISSKLDCPFLVKTYQFFENCQFYVFIMEYCPGGQLFYLLKQIKCIREDQARIYFIQILLGIQYIHKAGYMYRDLKPENILLDSRGFLKIADFGLSKQYHKKSYSFCGSIEYMAPQIIRGCGHKQFVDFYCLGALLFEMLVGYPPFYDSRCNHQQTKAKILNEAIYFPKDSMSQSAKDFIKKLTHKNEKQRLGYFGGCKQIMSHPWVGKINRTIYQQKQFIPPFPVNLNQLNFDPEQIGQSQRKFQQRVNQTMGMPYKSNNKIQSRQTISLQKKPKSVSQKKLTKNQSFSIQKNKSLIIKNIKYIKSPYETILRPSKNFKKRKQQKLKTQSGQSMMKKKLFSNVRWTQSQDIQKFKRILNSSNLQKKSKYIPFLTTIETNYSPQKFFYFQQNLKN